jgi:hypothetical protein
MRSVKRSAQRTVAEMRKEMVENNGVFLDWSNKIRLEALEKSGENINALKTISEKGFFIFETGCILPHPYYSKKGEDGPARFRGYKASANLFHSVKNLETSEGTNQDGWPLNIEVSHLCHWYACMNPDHLVFEPRWKNWKRLYCFGCDCNLEPRCLAKFHPTAYWKDETNWPKKVGYDDMKKLKSLLPSNIKILAKDHYYKEDLKANNRLIRLKRKRKHDKETKRKKKLKTN